VNVPVVLLHALATTSAMWRAQSDVLRRLGHPVLAPDLRGHGRTPLCTAEPSLDVLADDLARALDRHGFGRAVLAGSSMGGYVALAFLRRHPGRVRALALLGTRATADDPATAAGRLAFAERIGDPALRPALLAATTPRLVGATTRATRQDVVARVTAMAEGTGPAAVAWAQRAIAARPDSVALLRSVAVPAVVVAGAEDELVAPGDAELMADALPDGRLIVVPGAGHLTPVEAPSAVTAALTELIARAAGRPAMEVSA
jgi:pimeloyl-ACP methyl ester carboxylesterase